MTNEHKDLPALPKEDMTLNLLPGEPIQSRRRYTANQMTSYGIHCADSALAARPEPAGAGVEGIDTQDFKAKLSDYNVGMVSVVGLIAYIDAHVAAQVAKARLTPRVKDHVLAAVVNKLRDTAIQFHAAGQLRQRLREAISPLIGGIETTPQAQQPVASGDCEYLRSPGTACNKCGKVHGDTPAPDAGTRDAFAQFEILRKIPKVPGYCCGTKHTEYEAFELAIRALKITPAKPAQDLVAAIEAMHCLNPFVGDNCRLYNTGFLAARSKAAALVAAHLKGTT